MPEPLPIPVRRGSSVQLRPHSMADLEPVLQRCQDPATIRWTVVPIPYTRQMAQEYLAEVMQPAPDRISWAIERDGNYVGTIDLRAAEDARTWGDVGYVTHPDARGRGVMTEAVALAIDHAFETLGWDLLIWQANIGNIASYKPMWRNGFPPPVAVPALLNQRGYPRDGWHSVLEAAMPRHPSGDWAAVHAALRADIDRARRPG